MKKTAASVVAFSGYKTYVAAKRFAALVRGPCVILHIERPVVGFAKPTGTPMAYAVVGQPLVDELQIALTGETTS